MRLSYLLLLVVATLAASTEGLPTTDSSVQVNNIASNSNPTIANEDRYLKSSKKVAKDGIDDEERGLPSGLTKMKDMVKTLPNKIGAKYLKWVEAYWAKHPKLRAQANI